MILTAGLGTRLHPYTLHKPKALVEVNGIPMLEIIIRRLIKNGITGIIINVHHFAGQIKEFLSFHNNFNISVFLSDETSQLLETGGGLVKAKWFFNDGKPFLVHNLDALTNFNISELYNYHLLHKPLATLAVKQRDTSRSLLINEKKLLCGWKNNQTGETIITGETMEVLQPFGFSGVYILDPSIFDLITETGKFSIMDVFLRLARDHNILTWDHPQNFWYDMGRTENLETAGRFVDLVI